MQILNKYTKLYRCVIVVMLIVFYIFYRRQQGIDFGTKSDSLVLPNFNPRDISCHKKPESGLRITNENFVPSKNNIYFLETSCKGGLNSRQACAVESTARAHPSRHIIVMFAGPLSEAFIKGNMLSEINKTNIEFMRLNVTEFTIGTPLETIFLKDIIFKSSSYPVIHSSDVLRILILNKFGGLYLDLDVIVMKSFDTLPANFVAKQHADELSSGILAFTSEGIGRYFSEVALRDLAARYDPNSWAENGPALIERTLKKICIFKEVGNMTAHTCNGFHIMDHKWFYPIFYPSWRKYFEDLQPEANEAYMHHVWNKMGYQSDLPKNSLYVRLAQKYCPEVYKLYGDNFGL